MACKFLLLVNETPNLISCISQVGDVFLKNAYFSTDVGKNQISLAKLA